MSYAAAWELGRLLGLSAGSFAQSLIRWKHKEKTAILANKAELQVSHIGFARSANSPISADEVPEEISSFLNKLASLELVPLNYLLPEEAMLPIDSIRFFQVDNFWLKCLLEGAFSPGRFLSNDHQHELKLRTAIESVNFPVAGFLMRSEIVSAYPGLMAQGIDKNSVKQSSVMRRLSPHLMLCTFNVEVVQIDLHLAPKALHCGVENNFKKFVRKSNGELSKISKKVNIKNRKIAVKDLSDDLANAAKLLKFDNNGKAGFFALQMIEGVQLMRYKL
ncbi:hypothetical protein AU255_06900 [Methyloprofundus sedimenti]|uniref:Uncharacterized protein n=1 Tax=Methyloprofundus sedimenti TaxID=1420851 RepID=A0A1V8M877_9GAMM|nr:hypothetical protein AU255_06900 [Methyloprofundus sedimenti]